MTIYLFATITPSSLLSRNTKGTIYGWNHCQPYQECIVRTRNTGSHYFRQRPTYDCQNYKRFSKELGFQHITSSPRYPKSNGFIERQVQTVKHTLNKALKSGMDLHMLMLCLRSTPIALQLPSPAELLYQRKLKSNLPIEIVNRTPDRDRIFQRLVERQESMKYYHDRNPHDLRPLKKGQRVQI